MKNLQKIVIIDDEMVLRNGLKYLCDWEAHGLQLQWKPLMALKVFS